MGETRLNTGVELLDRHESLRLLATEQVGRLVVVGDNRRLEIFPVNYVLVADRVLFRTDDGAKLTATTATTVVFEVDQLDPIARSGWSVVVRGTASRLDPLGPDAMAAQTRLSSWVVSMKPHLVGITPVEITGRRIQRIQNPIF